MLKTEISAGAQRRGCWRFIYSLDKDFLSACHWNSVVPVLIGQTVQLGRETENKQLEDSMECAATYLFVSN